MATISFEKNSNTKHEILNYNSLDEKRTKQCKFLYTALFYKHKRIVSCHSRGINLSGQTVTKFPDTSTVEHLPLQMTYTTYNTPQHKYGGRTFGRAIAARVESLGPPYKEQSHGLKQIR